MFIRWIKWLVAGKELRQLAGWQKYASESPRWAAAFPDDYAGGIAFSANPAIVEAEDIAKGYQCPACAELNAKLHAAHVVIAELERRLVRLAQESNERAMTIGRKDRQLKIANCHIAELAKATLVLRRAQYEKNTRPVEAV